MPGGVASGACLPEYYKPLPRPPREPPHPGRVPARANGPKRDAEIIADSGCRDQTRNISISHDTRLHSRRLHIIQVFSEVPCGICCKLPFNDMQLDTGYFDLNEVI
jgi:hypothetical protein